MWWENTVYQSISAPVLQPGRREQDTKYFSYTKIFVNFVFALSSNFSFSSNKTNNVWWVEMCIFIDQTYYIFNKKEECSCSCYQMYNMT